MNALTYSYRELKPGVFIVWARDASALAQVKQEIKCGMCSLEVVTGVYKVSVIVPRKDMK